MLSYYLNIEAPKNSKAHLLKFFFDEYLGSIQYIEGIIGVRTFLPSMQKTAIFNDLGEPALLVQVLLASPLGLIAAMEDGSLADFRQLAITDCNITHQLFELVEHSGVNKSKLAYNNAKQSLAVRYYSTDSEKKTNAFRLAYLDGHPDALANFPLIKRIFCYMPSNWDDPTDIPDSNAIIGNEVVFDNIETLNAALISPAMAIVGHHSRKLPRFQGYNTHFPMTLFHEWLARVYQV